MPSDDIPTGRPVELTPDNPLVAILIRAQRNGWIKRQATKLGAVAAAYVAGKLSNYGGQEYAAEVGMGLAALIIYGIEAGVSWVSFKFSQVTKVEALTMPRPETMKEAKAVVRELSVKDASPPVVTMPTAIILLLALATTACRAHPEQFTPQVAALPVGAPDRSPPIWWQQVNHAITGKLQARYGAQK